MTTKTRRPRQAKDADGPKGGIVARVKGLQQGPVKPPYGSMLKPIKVGKRVIDPEVKK